MYRDMHLHFPFRYVFTFSIFSLQGSDKDKRKDAFEKEKARKVSDYNIFQLSK